jgi:orotidine-5'-phosphate decarboxylase
MSTRLIAAIDTADRGRAETLVRAVGPHCGLIKLGLEFYLRHGAAGLSVAGGRPVFLDLKLHDIPNTVAGAVRALEGLDVRMLTVHAGGGGAMVAAAVQAAAALPVPPMILGVTVLTSLDAAALFEVGVSGGVTQQVLRLARLALAAGAGGLVCSAREVPVLRAAFGPEPVLVVPGIRPAGADHGDQARVMTPAEAIAAGASHIVVGRPITAAPDPAKAAAAIAAEIAGL